MNYEQRRKIIAPLKLKQDKSMSRKKSSPDSLFLLGIRVIYGEEQNLNAGNSTDCADKSISDNVADELIDTDINGGDSRDLSEDAAYGLIVAINADS